jgi:hypothetical protein
MNKRVLFLLILGMIALFCSLVQANVIEFPMPNPPQYERNIGPMVLSEHSEIDIYIENIYDPDRIKDWTIAIWVPLSEPDITTIEVDYSNDPTHNVELERFSVTLADYVNLMWNNVEYKGFYADTWASEWEQCGTNPVGSGLPHPWGNPMWVSFHFEVNVDPILYIKDVCAIPEPASLCMLGLGTLCLLRKRRA